MPSSGKERTAWGRRSEMAREQGKSGSYSATYRLHSWQCAKARTRRCRIRLTRGRLSRNTVDRRRPGEVRWDYLKGRPGSVLSAAVEPCHAGRHPDTAQEMSQQQRLGVVLGLVSHRGVEGAAAVVRLAPGDGVVSAHPGRAAGDAVAARVVGPFVHLGENPHGVPWVGAEVVPLLLALPAARQRPGGAGVAA